MDLGELIAGLNVRTSAHAPAPSVRICDITDDSRTVLPGSLFIARAGTITDGRRFIPDALTAGAVAILTDSEDLDLPELRGRETRLPVLIADDLPATAAAIAERFYGDPTSRLELIGVTGTNGKTTVAHLVHQVLCAAGRRCGLIGTVMVDDGVSIGPATLTTPPATELSRTFGIMVEAGCRAAVMETSSHALEQGRVAALRFNIGIFTNLTGDHLDYHGTMDAYAEAKARLFAMLPEDGWAIVNDHDEWSARMVANCRAQVMRCRIRTEQQSTSEDFCEATIRSMTMSGTDVTFTGPWGSIDAHLLLAGLHNVMNALQATAACWAAGIEPRLLAAHLARATAPPGRLEPVTRTSDELTVLVDYAHTDDALQKVLEAIRPLVPNDGRLCVVFGCGGDRDTSKRPRMGTIAAELADLVVVTSDNPRTERPSNIIDDILAGIPGYARHKVHVEVDRRRAIHRAIDLAHPGDVILIAGKGHETEQIVADGSGGTIRHHFDDREIAREALAELKQARKAAAES